MMKVLILCEGDSGMAARCLPALVAREGVEVAGVISATPAPRQISRKLKKVLKIGLLGAINGVRLRKWYRDDEKPLERLCQELGVPYFAGLRQNSAELQERIRTLQADLGLSLGNGFISPKTFTIPRFGMLNVHSEVLPRYQNAQSIIWPIACADPFTGFTIHEVERKIDGGRILCQKRIPIRFEKSLELTVRNNRKVVEAMIPESLADVCARFEDFRAKAVRQDGGTSFTTPSIWSFLRMVRNNRRFYGQQN